MNDIELMGSVERLDSVFLNILYLKPDERLLQPNYHNLNDLKDALNTLFGEDSRCISATYTVNTDHPFFGIRINPLLSANDALKILTTDEKVKLYKYEIEFDSKLFDIGLDGDEIAALTIYEVSSMIGSYDAIDAVRGVIDLTLLKNDDVLLIQNSINHAQMIIYALKDTLFKVSSFIFKDDPEDLAMNPVIQACGKEEDIISAKDKIDSSTVGLIDHMRSPKLSVLEWMFIMYRDMKLNSATIVDTLNDAKLCTGSKIEQKEIDKTIESVNRIDMTMLSESLFGNLKKSGLRSIEADLYEFAMRIKNCSTEEDAMYILHGINNRLGILEDYLETENLKDYERDHWQGVANQYRELRIKLSKKKIWDKKQYGIFFDYNQLDQQTRKNSNDDDED